MHALPALVAAPTVLTAEVEVAQSAAAATSAAAAAAASVATCPACIRKRRRAVACRLTKAGANRPATGKSGRRGGGMPTDGVLGDPKKTSKKAPTPALKPQVAAMAGKNNNNLDPLRRRRARQQGHLRRREGQGNGLQQRQGQGQGCKHAQGHGQRQPRQELEPSPAHLSHCDWPQ